MDERRKPKKAMPLSNARKFYDGFGSKQDSQQFYERVPVSLGVLNARMSEARSIFEFGHGTGLFALSLFQSSQQGLIYEGCDISNTMNSLASNRLASQIQAKQATLYLSDHTVDLVKEKGDNSSGQYDRFVSNYVFDLMDEEDIVSVVSSAHKMLREGGFLSVTGVTFGVTFGSKIVMSAWNFLFPFFPSLFGGCRPLDFIQFLPSDEWEITFNQSISQWGIASQTIVAKPNKKRK